MTSRGRERRVNVNRQFQPYREHLQQCIVNVSRGGAFILSSGDMPCPGARISLSHTIVTDRIERIEGVARVVRVSEVPRGIGVVFEELTEASHRAIEELLDPFTMRPVGGTTIELAAIQRRQALSA